jgi:hypothetical protein
VKEKGSWERVLRSQGTIEFWGSVWLQLPSLDEASRRAIQGCSGLGEPRQSAVPGNEPGDMSETGLGGSKTEISQSNHACLLGRGRCTPCRLRAAGDEKQSAKPSARRNLTRDWAGTAGSEREIGATAHPTLPSAGNGRLGHVLVISSGSAGAPDVDVAPWGGSWQRRGPTRARPARQLGQLGPRPAGRGAGGRAVWGSFARTVSNRQAETTGRSVRSEEGTLQRARDGTWRWVRVIYS